MFPLFYSFRRSLSFLHFTFHLRTPVPFTVCLSQFDFAKKKVVELNMYESRDRSRDGGGVLMIISIKPFVHDPHSNIGIISSRLSSNSEALASELLDNLEEIIIR